MSTFIGTTSSYRPGSETLPGAAYTSPVIFGEETERIFARHWICAGRAAALEEAGDYLVAQIAGESIIVLRGREGKLRAFYNVCRHRGTRLCEAPRGRFAGTIQCPYHAWTWRLDGTLAGAPHMQDVPAFDQRDYPLHTVALAEWEGFVFLNLAAEPQTFAEWFAPVFQRFTRFNLAALISVRQADYQVGANWKLILQNYSECLHCPTIHPELATRLPYLSGSNDLVDGPFLGGYMEIRPPAASATMSGRRCGVLLGDLTEGDRPRAFYYTLFPAMMLSVHPDYALYYTVCPLAPDRSRVTCEWLMHPDSPQSPDYNLPDAAEFWDRTNRQDWWICEQSQAGVSSRVYSPGPYSPRESTPAAWDRAYLAAMQPPAH